MSGGGYYLKAVAPEKIIGRWAYYIAGAALFALMLAAVTLNEVRLRGAINSDLAKAEEILRNLLDLEYGRLRQNLQILAQHRTFVAAVEAFEMDKARDIVNAYQRSNDLTRIDVYDFEGDAVRLSESLQGSELADATRGVHDVKAIVTEVLKGSRSTETWVSVEGQNLVIQGISTIGSVEDPVGAVVITRELGADFIKRANALSDADISILVGKKLYSTTLPASRKTLIDNVLVRAYKQFEEDRTEIRYEDSDMRVYGRPLRNQARRVIGHVVVSVPKVLLSNVSLNIIASFILITALTILCLWTLNNRMRLSIKKYGNLFHRFVQEFVKANVQSVRLRREVPSELVPIREAINFLIDKVEADLLDRRGEIEGLNGKLAKVSELMSIDDGAFRLFVEKCYAMHRECAKSLKEFAADKAGNPNIFFAKLMRFAHTIKSNAALFNLSQIQYAAHNFESYLTLIRRNNWELNSSLLKDIREKLDTLGGEIDSYCQLRISVLGRNIGEVKSNISVLQVQWLTSVISRIFATLKNPTIPARVLDRLEFEFQRAVSSIGKEDLRDYVKRYDQYLGQLSEKLGKHVNYIKLEGNLRFIATEQMQYLNDVLVHCLRNAIDHGIERAKERTDLNKPSKGTITLGVNLVDSKLELSLSDDGAGIDPKKVRVKALENGLIDEQSVGSYSDSQVVDLIFETGVSTAKVVSEVSGRGVGMDVVRETMRNLGGDVAISETEVGKGTTLKLWCPYPDSRFMTKRSIFDLSSEVKHALSRFDKVYKAGGGGIEILGTLGQKNLVYADRRATNDVIEQLIFSLIEAGGTQCSIQVGLGMHSPGKGQRRFRLDLKVQGHGRVDPLLVLDKIDSLKTVKEVLQTLGALLVVDTDRHAVILDFPSNLPSFYCEYKLSVLTLMNNPGGVQELVEGYVNHSLGSWHHEFFGVEDAQRFFDTWTEGAGVVFIDDEYIALGTLGLGRLRADGLNVVVLAKDVSAIDSYLFGQIVKDPLVVEKPLDESAVCQALELSLLQLFAKNRVVDESGGTQLLAG